VDNDEDGLVDVEDPDCPPVEIDIRPGWRHNFVRPAGRGVVRVALLGSEEVDGSDVDPASLSFGPAGALPRHDLEDPTVLARHRVDVDDDGFLDLVGHYRTNEAGFSPGATEACLSGTIASEAFRACDEVITLCRRRVPRRWRWLPFLFSHFEICSDERRH
jgi:hypothetical protein